MTFGGYRAASNAATACASHQEKRDIDVLDRNTPYRQTGRALIAALTANPDRRLG